MSKHEYEIGDGISIRIKHTEKGRIEISVGESSVSDFLRELESLLRHSVDEGDDRPTRENIALNELEDSLDIVKKMEGELELADAENLTLWGRLDRVFDNLKKLNEKPERPDPKILIAAIFHFLGINYEMLGGNERREFAQLIIDYDIDPANVFDELRHRRR